MSPSDGPRPSRRSSSIKPFQVMQVMRRAKALESTSPVPILHLEVGQPSRPPPPAATSAAIASLNLPPSQQGYTTAAGLPHLRSQISAHYARRYAHPVPPDAVLVTAGSSPAFTALFPVLFDPADRVAVAVPGYPCYRHVLAAFSVAVVPVPVDHHSDYQPTLAQLRALHAAAPLKGLVLASPSNPTGSVLSAARLRALADWTRAEGVRLVVDEIYHCIARAPAPTAAAFAHAVVVSSLSKYWCLPGLRVGWLVVRCPATRAAVERALQNMCIAAPTVAQHAAAAALAPACEPALDDYVRAYLAAADALVEQLNDIGFEDVRMPDGAFYVWAACGAVCDGVGVAGSVELCEALLESKGVAITPGTDFDPDRGERFVRFSCAGGEEVVRQAGRRIAEFVREASGSRGRVPLQSHNF